MVERIGRQVMARKYVLRTLLFADLERIAPSWSCHPERAESMNSRAVYLTTSLLYHWNQHLVRNTFFLVGWFIFSLVEKDISLLEFGLTQIFTFNLPVAELW